MTAKRQQKPRYTKTWRLTLRSELLKEVTAGNEKELIQEIEQQIADFKQTILALQLYQRTKRKNEIRDVLGIIRLIDPKAPRGEYRIVSKFLTYRHEPSNIDADRTGV